MKLLRLLLLVVTVFPLSFANAATSVQLFNVEAEAQKHCPADMVVWLNTPSGIYHFKGMRWYANTIHGAYICEKEGDQAGYRATKNGQ